MGMVGIRSPGQQPENPYNRFAEKAAIWGSRDFLGARIDELGAKASFGSLDLLTVSAPRGYSDLFHLQSGSNMQLSDLRNPSGYWHKAADNLRDFRSAFTDAYTYKSPFFQRWTLGEYAREVLWESNIHPLTDTYKRVKVGDFRTIGSGLARLAGLGYLGYDTYREAYTAYHQAEERGKNRWFYAGFAFLKSAAKNLALWEIAGIGFVFGSKLLPGIGCLPVGGILAGVALACTVDFLVRKCLRTFLPASSGTDVLAPL
jgi:hypothetical protein